MTPETSTTITAQPTRNNSAQQEQRLPIQALSPQAKIPARAHHDDAGLDLHCLEAITLTPHQPTKIRTGLAVALPTGHVGMICDRSSMGAKGVRTLGGIVDAGYRGEIQVLLINLTNDTITLQAADKIAQLLILPIATPQPIEVTALPSSARGTGGFGSTGR